MAGHGGEHGACALCSGQASYVASLCYGACCSQHVKYTPVHSDMRSHSWALPQLPAHHLAWLGVVLLPSGPAVRTVNLVQGVLLAQFTAQVKLYLSAAGCNTAAKIMSIIALPWPGHCLTLFDSSSSMSCV